MDARQGRRIRSSETRNLSSELAERTGKRECELFYWRKRDRGVDFVIKAGSRLTAIEVKTGNTEPKSLPVVRAFAAEFPTHRQLLVETGGIPLTDLLSEPVRHWAT